MSDGTLILFVTLLGLTCLALCMRWLYAISWVGR
jgi:hypothetical protein